MADRERVLSWMVPRSRNPCMIMFTDDEDRARMSCGHAILPESLYGFCDSEIKDKKIEFRCPHVDEKYRKCNAIWHLQEVRTKACLNDEENSYFEEKLSDNVISKEKNIQQCPNCFAWSERQSPDNNCVRCHYCLQDGKQSDFCWKCLKTWLNEGTKYCGNPGCNTEDESLAILRTCSMKMINGPSRSGIECPTKRACPACGALIEHSEGCYKINCSNCHKDFCFICLTIAGYNHTPCNLAPRQTKLVKA